MNYSTDLQKTFYHERINQPELFQVLFHPDNINYVIAQTGLNIPRADFLAISIDVLSVQLREENRGVGMTLAEHLERTNKAWVYRLKMRFNPSGATEVYREAAANSFVQQPSKFTPPVATGNRGQRILVYDEGFGQSFTPGRTESLKFLKQY